MKGFRAVFLLLIFSLSSVLGVFDGRQCRKNDYDASKIAYTITVSQSGGHGNFTRVKDAVNAVPSGNDQWIRIYVDSGTYWEQVKIWHDQECIVLEGHSREDTIIVYNAHEFTDTSATFVSSADNFVAKNITFKGIKTPSGMFKVAISSKTPTLKGLSTWGDGQSIYEDCSINVTGDGYITAQGRDSPGDAGGFVFIRGSIYGNGDAYLGRAYASHSTVIFRQTFLSNVTNPLGWDAWSFAGQEDKFTYTEINCTGEGADTSKRVAWEKTLSASEASKYTAELFIDHDDWVSQLP